MEMQVLVKTFEKNTTANNIFTLEMFPYFY